MANFFFVFRRRAAELVSLVCGRRAGRAVWREGDLWVVVPRLTAIVDATCAT